VGGPLKPDFGLSGNVQISPILSSRPEQIIASDDLWSGGTLCFCFGRETVGIAWE